MIFLIIIVFLSCSIKVLKEYERGVIFRLGRMKGTKGPGLIFVIPFIDKMIKVDMRLISVDVSKQEVITKDNVPLMIDAVVYFRVKDPATAINNMYDWYQSTYLFGQTTLRVH
jgi:regulator of protease activity HflC (stomatin/prohibitin superfamily)